MEEAEEARKEMVTVRKFFRKLRRDLRTGKITLEEALVIFPVYVGE